MPEIIYDGPSRAVILDGIVCNKGEAVTFPKEIADSALEQDCWTSKTEAIRPVTSKPTRGITS